MNPVDHDQQMLENVYTGVLYPLHDAVVHFAFEAGVYNIVAKTRDSPMLAACCMLHAAIIRDLKVNWSLEDYPGWYGYDYWTIDVC